MMKNSRLSNVSIGIGGSLIIVIFVVLCLTIFSVLSFTTAYSDLKLSGKTEQITVDYYDIHGRAEEKLSEISDKMIEYNGNSSDVFNRFMEEKIREIDGITSVENDDKVLKVSFEVAGDKNQKINVNLDIYYDESSDKAVYDIISWNLSNVELPQYEDEAVDLWEGTEE